MNSIKAIISGIVFILTAVLIMQLAYLFIAAGFHKLARDYPAVNDYSFIFRYLIAIPLLLIIMFIGGYLTALISKRHIIVNTLIVAVLTVGISLWSALQNAEITMAGIIVNSLMLAATLGGGLFWLKRDKHSNKQKQLQV